MIARIIKSTGSWYTCLTDKDETIQARLIGKFRQKGLKTTNPLAVGDFVVLKKEEGLETAVITELQDRENYIIRKSPRNPRKNQIIASNLDQIFIIATIAQPRTSVGFIDRMLIVAEMNHIPASLIFNKKDLYTKEDMLLYEQYVENYRKAGYNSKLVSSTSPEEVNSLKSEIIDKTTLFTGHSGVGKSTLINLLIPDLILATKEISNYSSKGQHTTTFAEMHPLPEGGFIVDTPGIKELENVHIEPEEVSHYFPEMRTRLNDCHFNNCSHRNEPKCAIKEAVDKNLISNDRYQSYLRILEIVESVNYWER